MKYTLKKRLFANVLLNEKGQKLNLKNSPFTVKNENGNFSLLVNKKVVSPQLTSIEHSDDITVGTTAGYEKCQINLESGKVSKPYLKQIGKQYVLPNGEIVKFNRELESFATNFSAVINYGDKIKYPGNTYGKIVVQNKKNNQYGVMNEHGKIVCPCIFESPAIWFNFESEKQFPEQISDPLQLQVTNSLSCYVSNNINKIFNEHNEVVFESTGKQNVIKLGENNNEVLMSVYDTENGYSRIYTYNHTTKQFLGKALLKGVAVKYEKIAGDVYYGAVRQENNKLTLVNFIGKPITTDTFNTVEFVNMPNKTVAIVSNDNKYGVFDIRNREYLLEPTKTYSDAINFVKGNTSKEIIK